MLTITATRDTEGRSAALRPVVWESDQDGREIRTDSLVPGIWHFGEADRGPIVSGRARRLASSGPMRSTERARASER